MSSEFRAALAVQFIEPVRVTLRGNGQGHQSSLLAGVHPQIGGATGRQPTVVVATVGTTVAGRPPLRSVTSAPVRTSLTDLLERLLLCSVSWANVPSGRVH